MLAIQRLIKAIHGKRFAHERYASRKSYCGLEIQTTPIHCSYGVIGYAVSFFNHGLEKYQLNYDWEMDRLFISDGIRRTELIF